MDDPVQYRRFPLKASGSAITRASPEVVWTVIDRFGGDNGYFALDALWILRERIVGVIGGPGMERGRTHPTELRAGDRLDSWDVLVAEPGACLALRFNMKAPGSGVLEFLITPVADAVRLEVAAYWKPYGLAGVLYWRAMEPAHLVLFRQMSTKTCRLAENDVRIEKIRTRSQTHSGARPVR